MTKLHPIFTLIIAFGLWGCSGQEEATSQIAEDLPNAIQYEFTKKELTGLVMVTQGFLDGHRIDTGLLSQGATLLIFEEDFAWAIGETSPENLQSKHTKFSWKLDKKGRIILQDIPDTQATAPSPSNCTLTKIKEHKREFTKEGLAEKIDTVFVCDDLPQGTQIQQTFLLPLPLFPHMLSGIETRWSSKPGAPSTFQQDRTVKRPDPLKPDEGVFHYDPYTAGKYHHSIRVFQTRIERSDAGDAPRITSKHRLLMFGHGTIQHATMLDLSFSPIIFIPPGDDGYAHQSTDRYELHSVYRLKNLTYNPMTGNYADRPSDIARSVNANTPPLTSALVFR